GRGGVLLLLALLAALAAPQAADHRLRLLRLTVVAEQRRGEATHWRRQDQVEATRGGRGGVHVQPAQLRAQLRRRRQQGRRRRCGGRRLPAQKLQLAPASLAGAGLPSRRHRL
ncbi:hypothetical protein CFC21_111507, partial [Triticum aestivum]